MPRKKETRGRKPLDLTPKKKQQYIAERDNQWRKKHTKMISIRFNVETDADVLNKIASVSNKADYIRKLVRSDMEKGN